MTNEYGYALDRALDQIAGSYMRTVRYGSRTGLLCPRCGGFKNVAYEECRGCELIHNQALSLSLTHMLADRTAAGVYAEEKPDGQTMKMMYGYKDEKAVSPDYRRIIRALMTLALVGHGQCLNDQAGIPVSAWAMVPSTKSSPRYGKPHPLHSIIASVIPSLPEIQLVSQDKKTRIFDPNAFALAPNTDKRLMNGNVLLIDDSWITGGTVQSAAARLKIEGAKQVSIYCVARVVSMKYLREIDPKYVNSFHTSVHYIGGYCPWNRGVDPES